MMNTFMRKALSLLMALVVCTSMLSVPVLAATEGVPANGPVITEPSDTPAEPSAPEAPADSSAPEAPADSSAPEAPADSSAPEAPADSSAPEAPADSSAPEAPADSSAPEAPADSSAPEAPADSSAPEAPADSSAPVAPTVPVLPVPTTPVVEVPTLSEEDLATLEALLAEVFATTFPEEYESERQVLVDMIQSAIDSGADSAQVAQLAKDIRDALAAVTTMMPATISPDDLSALMDKKIQLLFDTKDPKTANSRATAYTKALYSALLTSRDLEGEAAQDLADQLNEVVGNEEIFTKLPRLLEKFAEGESTHISEYPGGYMSGAIIADMSGNSGNSYYTYCSQPSGFAYPVSGVKYFEGGLNASEFDGKESPLSRTLDAGYPLDLYGLSSKYPLLDSSTLGYATQTVIWNILLETHPKDFLPVNDPMYDYVIELYDFATGSQSPIPVNAVTLTLVGADAGTPFQLTYDETTSSYTADVTFSKFIEGVTVTEIPAGLRLFAGTEELTKGSLVPSPKLRLVLEVKEGETYEDLKDTVTGNLSFHYTSYEKVNTGSIHAFSTYQWSGTTDEDTELYQRMIGYGMQKESDALTVTNFVLSGGPAPTPPTPPTDTVPPTGTVPPTDTVPGGGTNPGGDNDRPEPPATPTVPAPTPEEPEVEIEVPDTDIPLGDFPEVEIPDAMLPLGNAPDEDFVVLDPEVPLGNLPQTGSAASQHGAAAFAATLLAAASGLGALSLSGKKTRR